MIMIFNHEYPSDILLTIDMVKKSMLIYLLVRSSSMSSNSSTSTRSSLIKTSLSSTSLTATSSMSSQRASKRSLSPAVVVSIEKFPLKRRRGRGRKAKEASSSTSSTIVINNDDDDDDDENDVEQENDDDDDIIPIKVEQSNSTHQAKQRQVSSGSIEYVQTLDNDQLATSSLNNIENIKSQSSDNDEEIVICRSPPSTKKVNSSRNKNCSKGSINAPRTRKSASQQVIFVGSRLIL
jgi:hypothetical protein